MPAIGGEIAAGAAALARGERPRPKNVAASSILVVQLLGGPLPSRRPRPLAKTWRQAAKNLPAPSKRASLTARRRPTPSVLQEKMGKVVQAKKCERVEKKKKGEERGQMGHHEIKMLPCLPDEEVP